jgi:RNA polymerase sigma factor (sigma-70 family)
MESTIEILVQQAKEGQREALEALVCQIQDRVYGLALRMLGHPADAEDAAQEILIKVITHLDGFRGESAFTTWAYRIASNHLLTMNKRRAERLEMTFELFEEQIHGEPAVFRIDSPLDAEKSLLVEEIRISCMQGMMLCLERDIRLAFILGEVFGVTSKEGAYILEITPEAFRKRLSRGRAQIRDFMLKNCSLIDPDNPCRCDNVVPKVKSGWIDPDNLLFARHPCRAKKDSDVMDRLVEWDEIGRVVALFQSYSHYAAPDSFAGIIRELLDSKKYRLLSE